MILIICHLQDIDAVWLYRQLQQATRAGQVRLVSAEELLYARCVTHTIGHSPARFTLTLQNGQQIKSEDIAVLINRLCLLDPVIWQRTNAKQYLYVLQELNALYLSMLECLPADRLYNPPTAVALSGRDLSRAEWQLLAVRAGLPIAPDWPPSNDNLLNVAPGRQVLVFAGQVMGHVPPGIAPEACLELAACSTMPLLELHFVMQETGYVFVEATAFAALHTYGAALIQRLLTLVDHGTDLGYPERSARTALAT